MKTTFQLQFFLIPKLSAKIITDSLNDFKPIYRFREDKIQQMQILLGNAGIGFRQTIHYSFPADDQMYIGFFCRERAARYSQAQREGLQKRLQESKLAKTRFIKRYKEDMIYNTVPQRIQTA